MAPRSLLLDIAGPAEAFRLSNQHLQRRGEAPRFRLRFAGALAQCESSVGLCVADLEPLPTTLPSPTWVVLVGQPNDVLAKP
ncbi:MAG TPA: AraC family transcriptional regulator, partial [Burkholderiaceae bacterium]